MSELAEIDPERIAELEREVEKLKGGRESSTLPAPKQPSQFAQGIAGQHERAREARVKAAERAAEAARMQARVDAPKLARLAEQLTELDQRIRAVQEMQASVERDLLELCVERAKLAATASRPSNDRGAPLHIGPRPLPGGRPLDRLVPAGPEAGRHDHRRRQA